MLVSISALEHWSYCPRQCGLIHLESVWDENVFTLRGAHAHERADSPITRTEKGVRVERALPVWSDGLGLVGKCDVVEFQRSSSGIGGEAEIVPVEYKSGGSAHAKHAAVQLCAQALCLEEMFGVAVPRGALFFAKTKERTTVEIDTALRESTIRAVHEVRDMLLGTILPPPVNDKRCPRCSLIDACLPGCVARASAFTLNPVNPRAETELP